MAGGFYGADVDELRRLGERLRGAADDLEASARLVSQWVTATPWDGRDADGFRDQWAGSHRAALSLAATGLRSAGQDLLRNAAGQADASAAGSGAHGSGSSHGTAAPQPGRVDSGLPSGNRFLSPEVLLKLGPTGLDFLRHLQGIQLPGGANAWDVVSTAASVVDMPVLQLIDDARTFGETWDSLARGDLSLYEVSDASVAILHHWPPLSLPHLIGDVTGVATEVARQAEKVDWSAEQFNSAVDYVRKNPWEAIDGVTKDVMNYLPEAANRLTSMFGIKV